MDKLNVREKGFITLKSYAQDNMNISGNLMLEYYKISDISTADLGVILTHQQKLMNQALNTY